MGQRFNVWAAGDAHVGTDIKHDRRSLAEAIAQSEGRGPAHAPGFDWDIMLDVGDLSGNQSAPDDDEGALVLDQYGELREHHRSQIYNIAGNHDASTPDEPTQWWFQKYGDPLGISPASGVDPAKRPFPVEGEWDHYAFTAGNLRFLMMSDRNDGGPPVGRGAKGGYPAGAVTRETFDWWVKQVETHRDKNIITVHHHMLKETTTGSGPWEGFLMDERDAYGRPPGHYHGYFADGGPMGSGYLYWVDGNPDAQAFERYLQRHPGAIDMWIGGHTHTFPDDVKCGRRLIERKWGVTFVNCAAMTQHHVNPPARATPMSRPLTFEQGVASVLIRCYLHTDRYAPCGFYDAVETRVPLRHAFAHPDAQA